MEKTCSYSLIHERSYEVNHIKIKAIIVENSVAPLFCICFKIQRSLKRQSTNTYIQFLLPAHIHILLKTDHFKEIFLRSSRKKCIYMMSLIPSSEPETYVLTEAQYFTHIFSTEKFFIPGRGSEELNRT